MVAITPPPLSAQSLADLTTTITVLCRGMQENGQPFWAYLCLKPSMAQALREAIAHGHYDLEEFGTILEWGESEEVPTDIRFHMERDYGLRHDYESELERAAGSV